MGARGTRNAAEEVGSEWRKRTMEEPTSRHSFGRRAGWPRNDFCRVLVGLCVWAGRTVDGIGERLADGEDGTRAEGGDGGGQWASTRRQPGRRGAEFAKAARGRSDQRPDLKQDRDDSGRKVPVGEQRE